MTLAGGVEVHEEADSEIEDAETVIANSKLELSFEYLMPSGELQWVTIVSSQAILMSLCLQSMVEELLRIRNGVKIKKAGEKSCTTQFLFKKKDGSEMSIPIRSGLHALPSIKVHEKILLKIIIFITISNEICPSVRHALYLRIFFFSFSFKKVE